MNWFDLLCGVLVFVLPAIWICGFVAVVLGCVFDLLHGVSTVGEDRSWRGSS